MATTTNLSSLVINYLTQAQYDEAVQNGTLNENQLYLTPAQVLTLATVARSGSYNDLSNKPTIPTIPVNNIIGSGTSGNLVKFDGANSITDGPALGSSTETYLRNDGTWQTPAGSFKNLGQNPVASDKYGLWRNLGSGWCFINTANLTTGQPSQWGIILNYVFGQEIHQIWMTQANGTCWERGYTSASTDDTLMPAWRRLNPTSLSLSLTVANWSNNSQTITATDVTASNNVIISPAPASIDNYVAANIKCTAQAANSLTFTCTTTPTAAISVNVLVMN